MDREEAIASLVREAMRGLDPWERDARVRAQWYCGAESDADLEEESRDRAIPRHLLEEIRRSEHPPTGASDPRYDRLVERSLRYDVQDATNEYLSGRLGFDVDGPEPELLACLCCGYRTLGERGAYLICAVCWWEDVFEGHPPEIPGPNRVTLEQGRRNFERFGASDPRELDRIDPDARRRYSRG
mgnify:CR=1 FL=1